MSETSGQCLNCNRTSNAVPLLRLSYTGREYWICPQCLPILIHNPERIAAVAGDWTSQEIDHEGG